jgi:hypothetical protein
MSISTGARREKPHGFSALDGGRGAGRARIGGPAVLTSRDSAAGSTALRKFRARARPQADMAPNGGREAMAHVPSRSTRTRARRILPWLAALALALVWPAALPAEDDRPTEIPYDMPGEFPQLSPKYKMNEHEVVLITDEALNPRLVTLSEGQLVAWLSYSASPSVIVFEREIARSMVCHSLVNFSIVEDELRSATIHAGEFASFCELKPGRYKYRVTRPNPLESALDAARRLEGEIIVGNPQGG